MPSVPASPNLEDARRRAYTGDKLDWMNAVSGDPSQDSRAFEVAFCIAQCINANTGQTFLSDETISDKTGIPRRWVIRARNSLKAGGWIGWSRTKTANVYWTLGGPIQRVVEHQLQLKEDRDERRSRRSLANRIAPPVAHLRTHAPPPVAQPETDVSPPMAELETDKVPHMAEPQVPPAAQRDVPQVANIHLEVNTADITPSKKLLCIEEPFSAIAHPQIAETRLIEWLGDGDGVLGAEIAVAIGDARFVSMQRQLQNGSLYPSAIKSATRTGLTKIEQALNSP